MNRLLWKSALSLLVLPVCVAPAEAGHCLLRRLFVPLAARRAAAPVRPPADPLAVNPLPAAPPAVAPHAESPPDPDATPETTRPAEFYPRIVSGTRATLFARFLGEEPGQVFLCFGGTSHACPVAEWRGTSVTVDLPPLGLAGAKRAVLRVVRPDGWLARSFEVLYVPQPSILLHEETSGGP